MPTKTDRILSYLPRTFQTAPRPKVLHPVVDAFGNELLLGENSLAEIMLSHWVDFADKNGVRIDDLERMAALFGLAPRRDDDGEDLESVEEFREHLKHYVRTFLEGTVTVEGILRVAAEALGLRIADETDDLDCWWTRQRDEIVTVEQRVDDASSPLNFDRLLVTGLPARPAQVTGTVDLRAGIDLTGPSILRLRVDGADLGEIDLAAGRTVPSHISLAQIVEKINESPRPAVAHHNDRNLVLSSPRSGSISRLELLTGAHDIAPRLLGLAPRSYHGSEATAAQLAGTIDLSPGANLVSSRFLRLEIDGKHLAELDCAGGNAAQTSLAEIRDAINRTFSQRFGFTCAADDGKHLILTSTRKGVQSSISIEPAAAQNAAAIIFGEPSAFRSGRDDQPARVTSPRDLRDGVDLSERANLRLRIDGRPAVTINCAGVDPARTQRSEIVAAINDGLRAPIAELTERAVSLASPTAGPASRIVFETAPSGDAAADIFGVAPLSFAGADATTARSEAAPVLTKAGGFNPWAQDILSIAVDGGAPVELNLRQATRPFGQVERVPVEDFVERLESVSLVDLVKLINESLHAPIAAIDGQRLLFTSPTSGAGSSLEIKPLEARRSRRFLSRAIVTDEATAVIFGFNSKEARGVPPLKARIQGTRDLSHSEDLSSVRLLRLAVDDYPGCEVDCAGPRPRATTIDEIVGRINSALEAIAPALRSVATHDGKNLILVSPSSGGDSRIVIVPPHAGLEKLLGVEPGTFRGQDDTQVRFTGTVDLSPGIALDPNAAVKLGFEDKAPVEVSLRGDAPNHQSIFDITSKINQALQSVIASTDGKHILLTSPQTGPASKLVFAAPSGHDATSEIFGIAAPRVYQGGAGSPARIAGKRDLTAAVDLRASRFLSLSVDGGPLQNIDCGSKAARPEAANLSEVVDSINTELRQGGLTKDVATHDGKHLILTSPTSGSASLLTVEPYIAGDARSVLLGDAGGVAAGKPATPAAITGEPGLLAPVKLGKRGLLRLAVDDGRPRDIDVVGAEPDKTLLEEIVRKINAVFPNLASATADNKLRLTSPTAGDASRVSVLPLRYIEVNEFVPRNAPPLVMQARHGDSKIISNDGAADTDVTIQVTAPQGEVGPTIVNEKLRWSVRLFTVLEAGDTVSLRRDYEGALRAEIVSPNGTRSPVPESRILVGPFGSQAWVPFDGTWHLADDFDHSSTLQLNNPNARTIVVLSARQSGSRIEVSVVESDITHIEPAPAADGSVANLAGRLAEHDGKLSLVDAGGSAIAALRAGPNVDLRAYKDAVVKVSGPLHADAPPLMIVRAISGLFDVTLRSAPSGASALEEHYKRVTIGGGATAEDSLVRQVNAGAGGVSSSTLVSAVELDKATVLGLPRGQTRFRYLDCLGSRFDHAEFNHARFPDGICAERGIFDVSRLCNVPPERVNTVFASSDPPSDPPVKIDFRWSIHKPGTFVVNLPADLPARFGARFNEARLGQPKDGPDLYEGAVAEPPTDPKFLANLITGHSKLLTAEVVPTTETGWSPVKMPFRKPHFLTLGKSDQAARLYLAEEGLKGFIKLEAREAGAAGNEIAVAARQVGPAIYDVSVIYLGGRFESARDIVLGERTADLAQSLLKPGPFGVLNAKAAGVRADVTRDRAEYEQLTTQSRTFDKEK